jgi:Domain of unknown function (DUF4386)
MKTEKVIGVLLIIGAIGVLVPYIILTVIFDYPNILRQETGIILTKFHEGGTSLIWTWWAFAILGMPLLGACILIGQKLEHKFYFVRWATTLGVIGLLVQMLGLLRWTFVVPVLADNFIKGNAMTKEASKVGFQIIHQYGGVVLGEHIGQFFTIAWTIMIISACTQLRLFPKWTTWLGYVACTIYLWAQTELFATVIPNFPVVDSAGFIGSTLWIIWLIVIGAKFVKAKIE